MTRNFLSWCIWLLSISSQLAVHSSQSLACFAAPPLQQIANRELSTANSLPCQDSSPACLQMLGDLAIQHNREIAVLEQAIQLQKKKRWTSWLNADGLTPIAMGLRIARNLAGGGDRAALQLEIARLELQRAELITNLRHTLAQKIGDYKQAQEQARELQAKLTAHTLRIQLAEIAYQLGEGTTDTLLVLWQEKRELQLQLHAARQQSDQRRSEILFLVHPVIDT